MPDDHSDGALRQAQLDAALLDQLMMLEPAARSMALRGYAATIGPHVVEADLIQIASAPALARPWALRGLASAGGAGAGVSQARPAPVAAAHTPAITPTAHTPAITPAARTPASTSAVMSSILDAPMSRTAPMLGTSSASGPGTTGRLSVFPALAGLTTKQRQHSRAAGEETQASYGTFLMDLIKQAFLKQKRPVDLDKYGAEFAYYKSNRHLAELPIALEDLSAEDFELYYEKSDCVLVPDRAHDVPDSDFHQLKKPDSKRKDVIEVIELESNEFSEDDDKVDAVPAGGAGQSTTAPDDDLFFVSSEVDDEEDEARPETSFNDARCLKCCTLLLPDNEDGNYDKVQLDHATKQHDAVCPRKTCPGLLLMADWEDAGGHCMPLVTGNLPEDLTGMDAEVLRYIKDKIKKVAAREEGRATPGPDELENDAMNYEASTSSKEKGKHREQPEHPPPSPSAPASTTKFIHKRKQPKMSEGIAAEPRPKRRAAARGN
ncbi:hypothetical protein OC835_006505 [Tilletia horrida]|nr:hypothetical protein OC835_006505 [Tilletia horrida]